MVELLRVEETIIISYGDEIIIAIGTILKQKKKENRKKINLIIGSEGGFKKVEIDVIKDLGGEIGVI